MSHFIWGTVELNIKIKLQFVRINFIQCSLNFYGCMYDWMVISVILRDLRSSVMSTRSCEIRFMRVQADPLIWWILFLVLKSAYMQVYMVSLFNIVISYFLVIAIFCCANATAIHMLDWRFSEGGHQVKLGWKISHYIKKIENHCSRKTLSQIYQQHEKEKDQYNQTVIDLD